MYLHIKVYKFKKDQFLSYTHRYWSDGWYFNLLILYLLSLVLAYSYYYPPNQVELEFALLVMFGFAQYVRIELGSYGNLTEKL